MADISVYFPSFMGEIREFKALAKAENPELELLPPEVDFVQNASFVETADSYGIGRLESITGIRPKATDTLDERKFRVLAKFNEYLPYTWNALVGMLNSLLGEDGYEKERLPGEFLVIVRVGLSNEKKLEAVRELLENVVPVNMGIDLTILYNRHYEVGRYRNGFLRNYDGGFSHEDIRLRRLPAFTRYNEVHTEKGEELQRYSHWYIRTELAIRGLQEFTQHGFIWEDTHEALKEFSHAHIRKEMYKH